MRSSTAVAHHSNVTKAARTRYPLSRPNRSLEHCTGPKFGTAGRSASTTLAGKFWSAAGGIVGRGAARSPRQNMQTDLGHQGLRSLSMPAGVRARGWIALHSMHICQLLYSHHNCRDAACRDCLAFGKGSVLGISAPAPRAKRSAGSLDMFKDFLRSATRTCWYSAAER